MQMAGMSTVCFFAGNISHYNRAIDHPRERCLERSMHFYAMNTQIHPLKSMCNNIGAIINVVGYLISAPTNSSLSPTIIAGALELRWLQGLELPIVGQSLRVYIVSQEESSMCGTVDLAENASGQRMRRELQR